ncbi:MUS81 [Ceraceosorus bombacis]|uniref:Crossover junction endonuclease MUS81 n=1 Tax=Ceraceosorus bombacis TaxID=401625 RepID=A0A0P1B815_9BASI|nr:MUS81 [Ceraceosorus bombacis]
MKRNKEPLPDSYLSKQQIIDLAKSFSDASYEQRALPPAMARGPISFNTAWSAMKTLIGRGYVYRTGNPPRFGLSALGFEVAKQCAVKDDVQAGRAISLEQGFEGEEKLPIVSAAGKGQRVQASSQAGPARSGAKAFCFTYVDPSGAHVLYRNKAAVRLSDVDYTPLYRIFYPTDQREHVFVKSCLDTAPEAHAERSGDVELLEGWVRESASNEKASGLAPSMAPPARGSLASCEDIPSVSAGQRLQHYGAADKALNAERLPARPAASISAGRASSGPKSAAGTQSLKSKKDGVAVSGRPRSGPKRSRKRSKISASSSSSDSESESDGRDIEEETTTTCASHQPSKRASATTSLHPHGASKTVARMARSNTDRSRRKPLSPAAKAGTSSSATCLQLLSSSSPPVQEQCAEQCNSSPPPLSSLLSNRFARQALRPKTPTHNTQPAFRRSASGSTASGAQKKRRAFCDAEIIELC